MLTSRGLPNNSLNPTGISIPLIVNLNGLAVVARQVNRGVGPLRMTIESS